MYIFYFFKEDPETNGNESPDDDVDLSSPESSPSRLSAVPFHPLYRVTVPDAVKNGDVLQFTIKVYKVCIYLHGYWGLFYHPNWVIIPIENSVFFSQLRRKISQLTFSNLKNLIKVSKK